MTLSIAAILSCLVLFRANQLKATRMSCIRTVLQEGIRHYDKDARTLKYRGAIATNDPRHRQRGVRASRAIAAVWYLSGPMTWRTNGISSLTPRVVVAAVVS